MNISSSSRYLRFACFVSLCFSRGVLAQSYSVVPVASADFESQAIALNNSAEITGAFRQSSGAWHAFLFNGEFIDLGTLGGAQSEGLAINSANDVVGTSDIQSPGARHAFLYHAGQLLDLNTRLSEPTSWNLNSAMYIGDAGQVIVLATSGGATQFFLLSPVDGSGCNQASTGSATLSESAPCYALSPWAGILSAGPMAKLVEAAPVSVLRGDAAPAATAPNSGTMTLGFNSSGSAVGCTVITAGETHAVLLSNGTTVDLNSQIRQDSGWTLVAATAINDFGQIAGNGLYQGRTQAYLLTPIRLGTSRGTGASASAGQSNSVLASPSVATTPPAGQVLSADAPTGAAGGVLAGTYPDPLLAGITAGPVVFGNGVGTIGQSNSFTFNSSTQQLSLTDAANTHGSGALYVSKGADASSTLDLTEADYTGKILRVLQESDQARLTPTVYIDNGAGMYMRSWLIVSGTTNGLTGDGYNILPPSNDPFMIGIWADVITGLQVRTAPLTGAYNYLNIDRHGDYTMSIEEDGSLKWGTTTRAAMDTGMSRSAAGMVEVNNGTKGSFADLTVRNLVATGGIQFRNATSGTAAASLGSNSPAASPMQPLTWVSITLPNGSQGWIPVWQ